MKFVVIDDDPTVSELMKRQLLKEGYKVIIAPNGKEGIQSLIHISEPTRPY